MKTLNAGQAAGPLPASLRELFVPYVWRDPARVGAERLAELEEQDRHDGNDDCGWCDRSDSGWCAAHRPPGLPSYATRE